MQKIDAHQHFWHYHPQTHGWISNDMAVLKQDFLPGDLAPHLQQNDCRGCVAVQASQTTEETEWLLSLAEQYSFIWGVVGWVDLLAEDLESALEKLGAHKKLKGIRHVIQDEPDNLFMLQPNFIRGVNTLSRFQLTYDLLIFDHHLPVAARFLNEVEEVAVVLDHIAKPQISRREITGWKNNISELANHPQLACKISGLVTEAAWNNWKYDDFLPYLDAVVDQFGADRLMIGSDWPVCRLAAEYSEVIGIVEQYFSSFSAEEKNKIFYQNAVDFYRLTTP